jgi:phage baseplate assembly protein W
MAGISVKLPLSRDPESGYKLNKTLKQVARQNLKMLVLTAPGERIMIPEFGVGLRNYLFENMSSDVFFDLKSEIISQAETYFPYITINSVTFRQESPDTQGLSLEPSSTSHYLNLVINFSIDSEITSETLIINL